MKDKNDDKYLTGLLTKGKKASKRLGKISHMDLIEKNKDHINDPESFISFLLITPFGSGFHLMPVLIIVIFLIELYLVIYISIAFICIPFILFCAIILQYLFWWRNWVNRLLYRLTGWNDLIRVHTISNSSMWRHVTITVKVKDKTGISYVKAALKIFCLRAYDKFYSTTHEARKEWSVSGSPLAVIAEGSANTGVFGQMMRLFRIDLQKIQKKLHCIDKVEIVFNQNESTIDPIPVSTAG